MIWGLFNFAVSGFFCSEFLYLLFSDLILSHINKPSIIEFFSLMAPVSYINIKVWYSQNCCLWILYILLLVLLTGSLGTVALHDFIPQKSSFNYLWNLATSHMLNERFVKWEASNPLRCCDFCQLCTFVLSHPAVSMSCSVNSSSAWGWRNDPVISLQP